MTKYFFINELLEEKLLKELMQFYNSIHPKDDVMIFLDSEGGYFDATMAILQILLKEANRTTLVAHGSIFSAAFILFFRAPCPKMLLVSANGMIHLPSVEVNINTQGKPVPSERHVFSWINQDSKEFTAFIMSLNLKDEQEHKVLIGEDVYFDYHELQRILNHLNTVGR